MFTYIQNILIYIGIYGIISLSLNLEYGYTGLGNFGKVAFVMLGAYAYALTSATLTFGDIMRLILRGEEWIAHGVRGISIEPALPFSLSSYEASLVGNIGLVFAFLALCFILVQLISNSPYGRIMRAIREDQLATDAYGKNVTRYKAQVFMVGSAIAGLGGALFAQFVGYIVPDSFLPTVTFTIWIMVILGGPGNNWGAVLGAAIVMFFQYGTVILKDYVKLPVDPNNLQNILFGALIIIVLFYKPGGFIRESRVRLPAKKGEGHG